MHQIMRLSSTSWLRTIILALALLDPVLPQLIAPEFSQAYAQLIASARTLPPWWMTCHENPHHDHQVCLQYMAPLPEENSTEAEGAIDAEIEKQESADEEGEEAGLGQVLLVLAEEGWKVLLQMWRQYVAEWLQEEQARAVQYDDNYASLNGGAIILRKSSHKIHNAQAILEDSSEKYLYSDAKLPIEVVIALKEEVKMERISIRSNEVYSSIVREFVLEGALDLEQTQGQAKSWFKLLSTSAKNSGAQQHFRIPNKVVRFIKLRIISKFGDWKYFTMTQLKVYGEGLFTQALIDYQTVQSSDPPVRTAQLQLATDLGVAYEQLMSFKGEKKPDENVLTFLLEKVGTLSKIHEFELFYMQNLSLRLENATRLEKEFREHKNQYNARNALYEKYRQQRKLEEKLAELEADLNKKLSNHSLFLSQLKYAELSAPQVCPNKEEEVRNLILVSVVVTISVNLVLSALVGYCCFRYFRNRHKKNTEVEVL